MDKIRSMKISETMGDFRSFILGTLGYGTCAVYQRTLRRFVKQMGDKNADDLLFRDFSQYKMTLAKNKRSSGYIAGEISALCCYLEFLRKTYGIKLLDIEDVRDLRPRVRPGDPNPLELWQYDELVENAETIEDRALMVLLFNTGLRISELISLTKDSFYEKEMVSDGETYRIKWLRVTGKGGKERSVPLNKGAEDILATYKSFLDMKYPKGYSKLFPKTYTTVWRQVKRVGRQAGIKVNPHMFRHTFATELLKRGENIVTIAKIMGHESLDTTKKYTKIVDPVMFNAVRKLESKNTG